MASTAPLADTTNPQQKEARFTEDFGDGGYKNEAEHGGGSTSGGTLKKGDSIGRKVSLRKSASKRVPQNDYSQQFAKEANDPNSALVSPIPTQVNPTEILATRFQNWRRVLKEFATFFKEIASQYEARAKSFSKVESCLNTTLHGDTFLNPTGGLAETHKLLSSFHHDQRIAAENARQIEMQIVNQLNAVRHDLGQKVKEIKALSGDFKNNVEKEKEVVRKSIITYLDALSAFSSNSESASKQDPFLVKLGVERQIRKLLAEENYLHKAYLNIESSGRELESIIVHEIQKAFRTYGEIVKNEGLTNVNFNSSLDAVLLQMPPDAEWSEFLRKDSNFVSPDSKLRTIDMIHYPGHDSPATTEIRSGPLERKSKYLKSFSPGWFVLSPTHLHEFKTSDRMADPTPVMSLYLPDSQIGSHSSPHAVNHKFMLKGKKTGALHLGHTWVFRAASHEAMMEWYEDIRKLTELSGPARDNFVGRRRTLSMSKKESPVADVIEEDDEDERSLMVDEEDTPYSAHSINSALTPQPIAEDLAPPKRPEAGRFGSDIAITQDARYSSSEEAIAAAYALPDGGIVYNATRPLSRSSSVSSIDAKVNTLDNGNTFAPGNGNIPPTTDPIPPNTIRKQKSGTFIHPGSPHQSGIYNVNNVSSQYEEHHNGLNQAENKPTVIPAGTDSNNIPNAIFVPGKTATRIEPTASYGVNSRPDGAPGAPAVQSGAHPITSGTLPEEKHVGMNGGHGDAVIPIGGETTAQVLPERPPKTPVPGTAQSTLENIHFPGEYPRQAQQ